MELVTFVLLTAVVTHSPAIEARFIGNSAFEVSDGIATILIDFPYQSGAFGYMTFPPAELRPRANALCLVTHRHHDHFDPEAVAAVGCSVAGPSEVQSAVPPSSRAGPGPIWHFGGARIECVSTPHAGVEHCSYLVGWHGVELFISGDVEDLDGTEGARERLDVLFLPSWLASSADTTAGSARQGRVVIHHHKAQERVAPCGSCLVPKQGETLSIPTSGR